MRGAFCEIDLNALKHNYLIAKQLQNNFTFAIMKANAYGHGVLKCVQALNDIADGFAIAVATEAQEILEHNLTDKPLLVLEGFNDLEDLKLISQNKLWTTIHSRFQLDLLTKQKINESKIFIKINTGMNRLGFLPEEIDGIIDKLKALGNNDLVLMTHFACADEVDNSFTQEQYQKLLDLQTKHNLTISACNSAALLSGIKDDFSRPGLMLYGISPFDVKQTNKQINTKIISQLQPVMSLYSTIISIKEVKSGEKIGYGSTFTTNKDMRLATVALGYADGYPRTATFSEVFVANKYRSKIIGRVSMDMLCIDITDLNVDIGEKVELWGKNILVNEVAQTANNLAYPLLCNTRQHNNTRIIWHYA